MKRYLRPHFERAGRKWPRSPASLVNIRLVAKTSDIRNLSQNIRSGNTDLYAPDLLNTISGLRTKIDTNHVTIGITLQCDLHPGVNRKKLCNLSVTSTSFIYYYRPALFVVYRDCGLSLQQTRYLLK